ncbi:MAG: SBBP repeat-containing protein [Acidobacteriia bacterium]|nr:SBBP repeat-containing protein [Terriglobia bacterium]
MLKALRSFPALWLLLTSLITFTSQAQPAAQVTMPLTFEANRGQTDPQVKYLARSREGTLFFTSQGVTVAVPRVGSFRLLFQDASTAPSMSAERQVLARSNYLNENPKLSITGVENYAALRYTAVYPGIDVRFYGQDQHLEHDFVLAPGADPDRIALGVVGIDHLAITQSGDVELTLGTSKLIESAPVAWQMVNGKRETVQANWRLSGQNRLGISLGAYDRSRPVTVDPVLAYSTHFGGSTGNNLTQGTTFPADTSIEAVALDPKRNIYVAGTTSAADFPTTAGAFNRTPNQLTTFHDDTKTQSGFVSKFDPTGRILIYSTFLHSNIAHIAVDSAGRVYTVASGAEHINGPSFDFDFGIFIDKLRADGGQLLYSLTFAQTDPAASADCHLVPGNSSSSGIAADNSGHIWVGGSTFNPCVPTTAGAFQTTMPNANGAGFVLKLDSSKSGSASILYSTYLGGNSLDEIDALTVDGSGNAYVAGRTSSSNFPHGASFGFATAADNGFAGFVSKLNAAGSALIFSVLLHGVDAFGKDGSQPEIQSIAIDSSRNVYLAGVTSSSGFPTTVNAFRRTLSGPRDGFVTKLSAAGNALVFSTLLGGNNSDAITGIGLNNAGMPFVTGFTNSTNFPVTANAFKKSFPAGARFNAFVTAFNPSGQSLYYSTLLGGSTETTAFAIFVDPAWNAFVAGNTFDSNYPVTGNAFQPGLKGNSDGFLARIVIAGDLRVTLKGNIASVARNGTVTFFGQVTNLGPDGSDNVVFTDPIPSGFGFQGIFTNSASFCSRPAVGATSGKLTCTKTRLEKGQSFWVNVYLKAVAPSGSNLTNKVATSAKTQDLNPANNSASVSVHVK